MSLSFPIFYRKFGVRMLPQMLEPLLNDSRFLELPLESVYHHLSYDGIIDGPLNDDMLFRNTKQPIVVSTLVELVSFEGMARKTGMNAAALSRAYYVSHRRMRAMRDLDVALKERQVPIVFNYSLLAKLYRYPQSQLTAYNKWRNTFSTAIWQMVEVAKVSNHKQYFFIEPPSVIPSMAQLNLAANESTATSLQPFHDPDSLVLLELWKWLGDDRESSLFYRIPKNKIHLINIIITETGKWSVINLGVLNSFRTADADASSASAKLLPAEDYVISSKQTVSSKQLNMRLLKYVLSLLSVRTESAKAQAEEAEAARAQKLEDSQLMQDETDQDDDETDVSELHTPDEPAIVSYIDTTPPTPETRDDAEDLSPEEFNARVLEEDALLDEELTNLNDIRRPNKEDDPGNTLKDLFADTTALEPESGIISLCNALANDGGLTPNDKKRFINLAQSYKTIRPITQLETLEELVVIQPDLLTLDSVGEMPDSPMIFDKSMLKSSLNVFDEKYITKVLHKDYANVVLAMQNAGIAVTGYKVEKTNDILGGYEEHVIRLTPVVGKPSTVRFKIPVVRADGSYSTNGVVYRLRKQRGDKHPY